MVTCDSTARSNARPTPRRRYLRCFSTSDNILKKRALRYFAATPNESSCAVRSLILNVVDEAAGIDVNGDVIVALLLPLLLLVLVLLLLLGLRFLSVVVVDVDDDEVETVVFVVETSFFNRGNGFSSNAPQ